MTNINIEDLNTRFPNNSKYYEELDEKSKILYINLYEKYIDLLINYLNRKINLYSYDQVLKLNKLPFYAISDDKVDLYQKMCRKYFSYIYIRNNIYIERLSEEEINLLNKKSLSEEEIDNFIEKTLKKVITELPNKNNLELCFGSDTLDFYKKDGTLLIGIRFDEFTDKIPDDDNWLKTYKKMLNQVNLEIEFINNKSKDLPVPIEAIKYNDFNVMSLNKK